MIGIIGAMEIEVESIKSLLTDTVQENISGVEFVSGKLADTEVVVAKCGVGKVFAALCAEAMILRFKPDAIINTGVAGCLDPTLSIGDIVIADSVVQHDMDTSPLGDPIGMLSDINIVKIPADEKICRMLEKSTADLGITHTVSTIASGDQFVADDETKRFITENFNAASCEMEGAAIGHVCYVNKVPFGVLRSMSDGADNGADMDFPAFTRLAAHNSTEVIKNFLSQIQE